MTWPSGISEGAEEFTDAEVDSVVRLWKLEMENDPLTLLDTGLSPGESEFKVLKGFARETGLYIATLTGSFVYTDSDTQWARLHETDGVHRYEQNKAAAEVIGWLDSVHIKVPTLTYHHKTEPLNARRTREFLRGVTASLRAGVVPDVDTEVAVKEVPQQEQDGLLTYKLRSSVPMKGFQRIDVSRLILTFGRLDDVAPVQLGLFLEMVSRNGDLQPQ